MSLLEQHLQVADTFRQGDRAPHLGLLMHATRGQRFLVREGGIALLRRELYPDPHPWTYCGLAKLADTQIKQFPGFTHAASQGYQYTAAEFLGNGFMSPIGEPLRIDFDGAGNRITPALPMFPVDVTATPIAGGMFAIEFGYDPFGQGGYPTDFQVFEGPDAVNVNYAAPLVDGVTSLAAVPHVFARPSMTFTSPAYGDRTPHVFVVRGRNGSGTAELNTFTTPITLARSVLPSNAPTPTRVVLRSIPKAGL